MDSDDLRLDGNAAGGELAALFSGLDMTMARRTCSGCLKTSALAEHSAYMHAPGIVLRCPWCDAVGLTLVCSGSRRVLSLDGSLHLL
jgi:hypothetical protein